MMPIGPEDDQTHFLNVDLDVWSRSPLDELVAAFGKSVYVLYIGRERRRYSARKAIIESPSIREGRAISEGRAINQGRASE
jgi:hypothetical protein